VVGPWLTPRNIENEMELLLQHSPKEGRLSAMRIPRVLVAMVTIASLCNVSHALWGIVNLDKYTFDKVRWLGRVSSMWRDSLRGFHILWFVVAGR
jgi:hypothetical protein